MRAEQRNRLFETCSEKENSGRKTPLTSVELGENCDPYPGQKGRRQDAATRQGGGVAGRQRGVVAGRTMLKSGCRTSLAWEPKSTDCSQKLHD